MSLRPSSRLAFLTAHTLLLFLCVLGNAQSAAPAAPLKAADIGDGIRLHYMEQGSGTPVVFVHGSLSDGGYWAEQMGPFAEHYHVIAYSRRYNYPNENPSRPGYSEAKVGKQAYDDIQRRMVEPMQYAFRHGNRESGIAAFIDYVFNDPSGWTKMPESARKDTLKDAHEWDVMMTTGTLFPEIDPEQITKITVPTLLLSGAKSYPFLALITEELAWLLPNHQNIVFPDAGHQMWYQKPVECREDVENFLTKAGIR